MNKQINRESLLVISGQILILIIGFAIKHIQTDGLSPQDFGNYTFISSFISFSILFFHFGVIPSLKVAIAECKEQNEERRLIGLGFLITLSLGFLFGSFVFICSFFIDQIFNTDVGSIFLILAPLFSSFMLISYYSSIGIGSGKPALGIYFEVFSRFIYLLSIFLILDTSHFTIENVFLFSAISHLISGILFLILFKPIFSDLINSWKQLIDKHRQFGRAYYFGSIANQSAFKLDDLLITAWVSPVQLGYYALARLISSPIGMASTALNNALFKTYAKSEKVENKIFIVNGLISLFIAVLINILGYQLIKLFFGKEYLTSSEFIFLFSIAFIFMALYQPFNFLTAKGQGKVVRNTAYVESLISLGGNFILIPLIGIKGALYTSIMARASHFFMKWYYYRMYIRKNSSHE